MAKKTCYEVISIFDGQLDAADVFAGLIYEKEQARNPAKTEDSIAGEGGEAYNSDKVQMTAPASGLCA